MRVPITVIIHSLNEEINIPFTLRDISGWADQIVLVDSDSTDKTQEIARDFDIEVISRKCERGGLVDQRNWALETIKFRNEWVFILDSDETIEQDLKEEIERLVSENNPDIDGYWARFKLIFCDQWIKRSSMYPSWTMRLFRHEKLRYEKREVNSAPIIDPSREGFLQGHTLNQDRRGFTLYLKRLDEFSTLEARAYIKRQRGHGQENLVQGKFFGSRTQRRRFLKNVFIKIPFRPLTIFVYLYIVRLGFLEGRAGFDYCFFKLVAEWAISVKLREKQGINNEL